MEQAFVHELFRVIDNREWDSFDQVFDPEVTYERPGYEPFVGMERLHRFYTQERVIAEGKHHLTAVVVDENHGASWGVFRGTHRNGSPIEEAFADVYTFENGRIKTRKSFFFRPAV